MSFGKFVSSQTQVRENVHKILGLVDTFKGQHYLYSVPTGGGKSKIIAAAVADLLKSDKRVLLYLINDIDDMLLKILAPLTGFSFQDLNNSNFREKEHVQAKIQEVSKNFDTKLVIEKYVPGTNCELLCGSLSHEALKADVVFIEDIQSLSTNSEKQHVEFARKMNTVINNLNNVAQTLDLPIISFANGDENTGYLQNAKSETVYINPPYSKFDPSLMNIFWNSRRGKLKLLENFEFLADQVLIDPPYETKNLVDTIIANPPYQKSGGFMIIVDKEEDKSQNKIFLYVELETWKNQFDAEFAKEVRDYTKIKTLCSRINQCVSSLMKLE